MVFKVPSNPYRSVIKEVGVRAFLLFLRQHYWQLKGNSYNSIKITVLKMFFFFPVWFSLPK